MKSNLASKKKREKSINAAAASEGNGDDTADDYGMKQHSDFGCDNSHNISRQNFQTSRSGMGGDIFDRLHGEAYKKQEYKNHVEELKILNELKDCTFQPLTKDAYASTQEMNMSKFNATTTSLKNREDFFNHLAVAGQKAQKL